MGPESTSVGKTPTAPLGAGSAAGLGVTPADLEALRRAVRNEDYECVRDIISGYLERRGFNPWWEGLKLYAYSSEARGVIAALRELFDAAGFEVEITAWPSGGYGPVLIAFDLPWGMKV